MYRKVKIFHHSKYEYLEEEVNKWFLENDPFIFSIEHQEFRIDFGYYIVIWYQSDGVEIHEPEKVEEVVNDNGC